MTKHMTTEEIAVGIVEMRLAGIHTDWIRWFTRGQWHQRADILYVLKVTLTGSDTYVKSPFAHGYGEVTEFLETTLKEKQ